MMRSLFTFTFFAAVAASAFANDMQIHRHTEALKGLVSHEGEISVSRGYCYLYKNNILRSMNQCTRVYQSSCNAEIGECFSSAKFTSDNGDIFSYLEPGEIIVGDDVWMRHNSNCMDALDYNTGFCFAMSSNTDPREKQ